MRLELWGGNNDGVRVENAFGAGWGEAQEWERAVRLQRGMRWGWNEAGDVAHDTSEVGDGNVDGGARAVPSDLAGVFALLLNAGAHHGVGDVAGVGVLTLLVIDDGDVSTSQGVRQVYCGWKWQEGMWQTRAPRPPSPHRSWG